MCPGPLSRRFSMTELNDERWAFVVEWFDSSADLVRTSCSTQRALCLCLSVRLTLSLDLSLDLSLQVRQYQLLYYLMDSTLEMVCNRSLPLSLPRPPSLALLQETCDKRHISLSLSLLSPPSRTLSSSVPLPSLRGSPLLSRRFVPSCSHPLSDPLNVGRCLAVLRLLLCLHPACVRASVRACPVQYDIKNRRTLLKRS
eukprot:COSAG03_NODE_2474_length_2719_cov_3.365370_1_plen_198_part_10